MTTRTILLAIAATVTPLYAQQAAPTAAQTFTTLAAAPATAPTTATPEQRASAFNALALLPQNISDFAVFANLGSNLRRLAACGSTPTEELPAELLALDNVALASTAATPATYALLQHTLVGLSTLGSSLQLADDWATAARAELRDTIVEGLVMRADASVVHPGEAVADGAHLPASYVVLTCKPGGEALLQECAASLLTGICESGRPGIETVEETNGFSGIRINVVEACQPELESLCADMAPRRKEMVLQALARHPLYLLTRRQGNALILALCENPQELQTAATPADSLLATDKLADGDGNLGKGMIAYGYMSPALAEVAQAVNTQPTLNLATGLGAAFTRLGEVEPTHQPVYNRAAAALGFLAAELQKYTRPITRPTVMQLWCDGHLHLDITSDARGCSYQPGTLRLAAMADEPMTSLYAETTPMQTGVAPPDGGALVDAVLNVAEGFTLTLADEERNRAAAGLGVVKSFMPELQLLAEAGSTIGSGLNGQMAVVLDSTQTPLPAIAGSPAGVEANLPRFVIFAGVRDRSKLADGWNTLLSAAGKIAGKLGTSPSVVDMLPITSRQMGNATSYSLSLPFFTREAVPSLAVSDTGLALGSSSTLTAQVTLDATGTTPFTGAVFALRFKPLARTLRSLATALDPAPEEAEPAARSDIRLEKEKEMVHIATVGGADGPTSIFLSTELEVGHPADGLSLAAYVAEQAAAVAEGVYGTSTIDNERHTLHIEVKPAK